MKKLYGMNFKEYKNRLSITILLVAIICFTIGTMTGVTIVCEINDLSVETEEATTIQVVAETSVKEDPIEYIPTFNPCSNAATAERSKHQLLPTPGLATKVANSSSLSQPPIISSNSLNPVLT